MEVKILPGDERLLTKEEFDVVAKALRRLKIVEITGIESAGADDWKAIVAFSREIVMLRKKLEEQNDTKKTN
jgi:hypothetical protein